MAKKTQNYGTAKLISGVALLIVAAVGLVYSSILGEMGRAEQAYRQGDTEEALNLYTAVEGRLRSWGALRVIPSRDRQNLILNQARLQYALGQYDEALEKLEHENEVVGLTEDGRFFLLRGNIAFRKSVENYQQSETRDVRVLEEALLGAEDNMRDAMRLDPGSWDAKFNYEFINYLRKMMTEQSQGSVQLLQELEFKERPPALPPEQQH